MAKNIVYVVKSYWFGYSDNATYGEVAKNECACILKENAENMVRQLKELYKDDTRYCYMDIEEVELV